MQCRTKYNSKKPRPKTLDRRIFETIVAPILPEMLEPVHKTCSYQYNLKKKEQIVEVSGYSFYVVHFGFDRRVIS